MSEKRKVLQKFSTCFQGEPKFQQNSYPLYRRRNDGKTIQKIKKRFTNRHVVPYNPELSRKFDAHINVEVCATVLAVKYLFKCILKGADRLQGQFENKFNELLKYVLERYLAASDAIWRFFHFHYMKKVIASLDYQYIFQTGNKYSFARAHLMHSAMVSKLNHKNGLQ